MKYRRTTVILELLLFIFFLVLVVRMRMWFALIPVIVLGTVLFTQLFFFRDPERKIPSDHGILVSPADGRIVEIQDGVSLQENGGPYTRIGIFLSLWNVHINRIPISGTVREMQYREGRYLPAFFKTSSRQNASNLIRIETVSGDVYVRQVAGFIARRIICRLKTGEKVVTGQRFGMILFGSRVELLLPVGVAISVRYGETVKGGVSVIGKIDE